MRFFFAAILALWVILEVVTKIKEMVKCEPEGRWKCLLGQRCKFLRILLAELLITITFWREAIERID